jgi:hypothetical protein
MYALELFMYLSLRNSLHVREQWESHRHIGAWRGLVVCSSLDGISKQIFSAPKVGWIRNADLRCLLGFTFLRNPVLLYIDSEAVLCVLSVTFSAKWLDWRWGSCHICVASTTVSWHSTFTSPYVFKVWCLIEYRESFSVYIYGIWRFVRLFISTVTTL